MSPHREGRLGEVVDDLRRQLADVSARLAQLEKAMERPAERGRAQEITPSSGAVREEEVPEEVVLVISAVVAAFLGERVRVRQVRLISSPAWGLQGRASIQASHRLDR